MTVPAAPLPSVANLFAAFTARESGGRQWSPINPPYVHRFYRRGSIALLAGIEAAQKNAKSAEVTVWLPDYFCNEALEPSRMRSVGLKFYPIQSDLAPDFERVSEGLEAAPGLQILVLVHYFGFPNATRKTREFCDRHGMVLIEDSAHMLHPASGTGVGDLMIFSPRKVLALPSGGLLLAQARFESYLDPAAGQNDWSETIGWIARRVTQKVLLRLNIPWHRLKSYEDAANDNGPPGPSEHVSRAYNSYALRLLKVAEERIPAAIDRRRANYARLAEWLRKLDRIRPLFAEMPDDVCPYAFPVIAEAGAQRLVPKLQAAGIMASRWPDLPPEVTARYNQHETAIRIYDQLILLPIHQSLGFKDVDAIGRGLQRIIETT